MSNSKLTFSNFFKCFVQSLEHFFVEKDPLSFTILAIPNEQVPSLKSAIKMCKVLFPNAHTTKLASIFFQILFTNNVS